MPAASLTLQPPRVNTAAPRSRPIDNTQASVLHCGKCVSCPLSLQLTGPAMEQLQEMFGPLVEEQLGAMDWAPVKREAEGETAPANRGKAPRTEQGKGGPGPQVHSNKPPWRRAGGKGRHAEGPHHTPTGDRTQDSPPGLQLGPVCPTGEPRTTPNALCSSPKVEESSRGEHNNHDAQNSAVWLLDPDASCGTQGHRERGICPFPEKSGGDEMVEGWPLKLSKVVPRTREPGGGRSPGPSATHQAYRGDHGSAAVAHAAPHDTSVSCHQAPHGEHDRHCDLPAGYLQPHLRTSASMGMPRDIDRPHGSAGHRTPASEGPAQTVTGCRASPTSIGRLLLIRLLNSSNTCYMNASIRAWLFAVSHTQVADILKYGQHEQAWRDVYHARRPIHVHSLPSWRPLLRNWAQLHRQHDAGEFLGIHPWHLPATGIARQVGIQNC